MQSNDAQLGSPGRIFSANKAVAAALSGLTGGEIAYALDTHEFGFYNGSQWQWFNAPHVGGGDMYTSVYDPSGTGRVLLAKDADTVDSQHASAFAAVGHTHAGVSGTSDHGQLTGLLDDDHPQYMKKDVADTFTSKPLFNNLSVGDAPFSLGSQLTGVVSYLNADKVDGQDASAFAAANHTHSQYVQTDSPNTISVAHSFTANPPMVVSGNTMVSNLNAQYLGGHPASYFLSNSSLHGLFIPINPRYVLVNGVGLGQNTFSWDISSGTDQLGNPAVVPSTATAAMIIVSCRWATAGAGSISVFPFNNNTQNYGTVSAQEDNVFSHIVTFVPLTNGYFQVITTATTGSCYVMVGGYVT